MTTKRKIVVTIEKTDTGFSAFAKDYPVFSTGSSMSQLIDNCIEAFSLFFEDEEDDEISTTLSFPHSRVYVFTWTMSLLDKPEAWLPLQNIPNLVLKDSMLFRKFFNNFVEPNKSFNPHLHALRIYI